MALLQPVSALSDQAGRPTNGRPRALVFPAPVCLPERTQAEQTSQIHGPNIRAWIPRVRLGLAPDSVLLGSPPGSAPPRSPARDLGIISSKLLLFTERNRGSESAPGPAGVLRLLPRLLGGTGNPEAPRLVPGLPLLLGACLQQLPTPSRVLAPRGPLSHVRSGPDSPRPSLTAAAVVVEAVPERGVWGRGVTAGVEDRTEKLSGLPVTMASVVPDVTALCAPGRL